ncbi:related to sedlin [Cephalotrichum gorgonifer]|uniref:Related to sedlin n=1 Tax=Cephalotrichum gorgonifer TaxID=2041049 RepID=A0AAE8N022_9PEZI|nr:related to sedlin [Cephalotrichum gorgonifer]
MSYYFVIVGTQDNPLFEHEFGTSKQGGDGNAHFAEQARSMNQFIVHSSLDILEEVQWSTGQLYLKHIDRFFNNYISAYVTPTNAKFLLLHQPLPSTTSSRSSAIGANPTSPATEEAVRNFFTEVYENWVKATMNPFYRADMEVTSPVFRQRVTAAGRKYL